MDEIVNVVFLIMGFMLGLIQYRDFVNGARPLTIKKVESLGWKIDPTNWEGKHLFNISPFAIDDNHKNYRLSVSNTGDFHVVIMAWNSGVHENDGGWVSLFSGEVANIYQLKLLMKQLNIKG